MRQAPPLQELFELRRIVECEAAALAAERHDAGHLEQMDSAVEEMAAAWPRAAETSSSTPMSGSIWPSRRPTGNRLLAETMEAIRDVLRSALAAIFEVPHSAERAIDEHRAIRAAIAAGDPDRARAAMRAHLDRVEADARLD